MLAFEVAMKARFMIIRPIHRRALFVECFFVSTPHRMYHVRVAA